MTDLEGGEMRLVPEPVAGDPTPGRTVGPFARALAAERGQMLDPTQEVLWLTLRVRKEDPARSRS